MATYKRVMLTERNNTVTEKSEYNHGNIDSTVKKQLKNFDNSYTSQKLNELYEEFDAITFDMPSISTTTASQTQIFTKTKTQLDFKTKLYLTSAVVVTLLLAFLAIFNIFVINGLNGGIKLLQEEMVATTVDYNSVLAQNEQLKNIENILNRVNGAGFSEVSSNTIVDIPLMDKVKVETIAVESNWFNDFCNFIGGLLGS